MDTCSYLVQNMQKNNIALENHKACNAGTKNIRGSELKNFPYINEEGETATYTDDKMKDGLIHFYFIAL